MGTISIRPTKRADEQPVVEADDVEAGRQHRSDREHHQEAKPRVRAEAAVEREVGLARLVALRLGCERREQLDDRVALRDAVPGGGEREEDRDDRLARLVPVGRDRVEELRPRGELVEVLLEPGEHALSDSCRMTRRRRSQRSGRARARSGGAPAGPRARRAGRPLRRRRGSGGGSRPTRGRGAGRAIRRPAGSRPRASAPGAEEDEDAPHLPDAEGERGDCERGGGRLRRRGR